MVVTLHIIYISITKTFLFKVRYYLYSKCSKHISTIAIRIQEGHLNSRGEALLWCLLVASMDEAAIGATRTIRGRNNEYPI